MGTVLTHSFFSRETLTVARGLLGCALCHRRGHKTVRFEITEVEAYDGPKDRASHAACGKTARNAPMFLQGGIWYVYFTYGMHWMLNIVAGREGYPAAVLIRGAGGISGPARLTKFLKIDGRLNGTVANRKTGLWIERGAWIPEKKIERTPRIGVAYAGRWAKKPYRFTIEASLGGS